MLLQTRPPKVGGDDGLTPEGADDPADAKEGAEGEFEQAPTPAFILMGQEEKDERDESAEEHADGKGEKCTLEAKPGGEQCHELGIAEAEAFAAADEPVEPA